MFVSWEIKYNPNWPISRQMDLNCHFLTKKKSFPYNPSFMQHSQETGWHWKTEYMWMHNLIDLLPRRICNHLIMAAVWCHKYMKPSLAGFSFFLLYIDILSGGSSRRVIYALKMVWTWGLFLLSALVFCSFLLYIDVVQLL